MSKQSKFSSNSDNKTQIYFVKKTCQCRRKQYCTMVKKKTIALYQKLLYYRPRWWRSGLRAIAPQTEV